MIGFIGLGIMGKPMAENLLRAGHHLMVYDIQDERMDALFKMGAKTGLPEEIARQCKTIFMILPNAQVVTDVLFGEHDMVNYLKKETIVCDMSSVTPDDSKKCAARLWEEGIEFMDIPVSGGEPKAIDGTLAFMAGGKEEVFQKVKKYLYDMGDSAILVGGTGSGSVAKLANQIIVNLNIVAVSEAFVLAKKAGADPEKVYEAIREGLAGSAVLEAKIPKILDRDFQPGGRISINHKDIRNVLSTAHDIDVPLPFTSQLFEVMQTLKVDGKMEEDHSGLISYFEKLAGVIVERKENGAYGDKKH